MFIKKMAIAVLAIMIVALSSSDGRAAMSVIDNSNLAQAAIIAAKTADVVAKTTEMATTMSDVLSRSQSTLESMGMTGSFSAAGDVGGVLASPPPNSPAGASDIDVSALQADVSSLTRMLGRLDGLAGAARNIDSPSSAIRLVRRSFGLATSAGEVAGSIVSQLSPEDQLEMREARFSFAETSAGDAVGLAMYNRESIQDSAKAVNSVRSAATSAATLREQMAVNTAAILAVVEELQHIRTLLAADLQMSGADFFAGNTPSGFLGLTDPDGDKSQGGSNQNSDGSVFQ